MSIGINSLTDNLARVLKSFKPDVSQWSGRTITWVQSHMQNPKIAYPALIIASIASFYLSFLTIRDVFHYFGIRVERGENLRVLGCLAGIVALYVIQVRTFAVLVRLPFSAEKTTGIALMLFAILFAR